MTEQQRRQQIMEARSREGRATQSPMSDAEAAQIAAANDQLTPEQMLAAAMLGKLVNHQLNETRKLSGDGMKIPSVDMSKVMPSGIVKNMNIPRPAPVAAPIPVPVPENFDSVVKVDAPTEVVAPVPVPRIFTVPKPTPTEDTPQMELDFNKQVRYEDIMQGIDKLRDEVKILSEQLAIVTEYIIKKKPKKPLENGTQPG